jgi:hypothetical protein
MLDDTSVLMNCEAQEWKLKMYSGRQYDQIRKLHYLRFSVLPAVTLTLQSSKIVSQMQKAKCVLWYHKSVVQVRDFIPSLESNHPRQRLSTSGISCSMKLAAFVEETAPSENHSLKLRLKKFNFYLQSKKITKMRNNQTCHKQCIKLCELI